jgi:hypothetical protein
MEMSRVSKLFEPSSRRDFPERRYALRSICRGHTADGKIPLPPMPTMFESNTPFPEVQKCLDAFDDYLAYRYFSFFHVSSSG